MMVDWTWPCMTVPHAHWFGKIWGWLSIPCFVRCFSTELLYFPFIRASREIKEKSASQYLGNGDSIHSYVSMHSHTHTTDRNRSQMPLFLIFGIVHHQTISGLGQGDLTAMESEGTLIGKDYPCIPKPCSGAKRVEVGENVGFLPIKGQGRRFCALGRDVSVGPSHVDA